MSSVCLCEHIARRLATDGETLRGLSNHRAPTQACCMTAPHASGLVVYTRLTAEALAQKALPSDMSPFMSATLNVIAFCCSRGS